MLSAFYCDFNTTARMKIEFLHYLKTQSRKSHKKTNKTDPKHIYNTTKSILIPSHSYNRSSTSNILAFIHSRPFSRKQLWAFCVCTAARTQIIFHGRKGRKDGTALFFFGGWLTKRVNSLGQAITLSGYSQKGLSRHFRQSQLGPPPWGLFPDSSSSACPGNRVNLFDSLVTHRPSPSRDFPLRKAYFPKWKRKKHTHNRLFTDRLKGYRARTVRRPRARLYFVPGLKFSFFPPTGLSLLVSCRLFSV